MEIGELIKARRKDLGLTREQVSEKTGISPITIWRMENGRNLAIGRIIEVAEALGCRVEIDLYPIEGTTEAAPE